MPMARKNVSRMKKFAPPCPEILAVSNLILPVGVTAPAIHLTSRYAHRIPMMANVWNPGDSAERNLLWNSPSLEMHVPFNRHYFSPSEKCVPYVRQY